AELIKQFEAVKSALTEMKIESRAVDEAIKALDQKDEEAFKKALGTVTKSLSAELGERVAQLGSTSAVSKFFANEAYQADGPFAHIVTATQAAEAEATAKVVKDAGGPELSEEEKKGKSPA